MTLCISPHFNMCAHTVSRIFFFFIIINLTIVIIVITTTIRKTSAFKFIKTDIMLPTNMWMTRDWIKFSRIGNISNTGSCFPLVVKDSLACLECALSPWKRPAQWDRPNNRPSATTNLTLPVSHRFSPCLPFKIHLVWCHLLDNQPTPPYHLVSIYPFPQALPSRQLLQSKCGFKWQWTSYRDFKVELA